MMVTVTDLEVVPSAVVMAEGVSQCSADVERLNALLVLLSV